MRRLLGSTLLIVPLLTAGGCASAPEPFMHWRKGGVEVRIATPQEVDQVIWSAREELRFLEVEPLWQQAIQEATGLPLDAFEVAIVKRESLFGVNWRPDYTEGLAGRKMRAQLTVSIDRNWFNPDGQIKAEAILAGIRDPDHQGVKELSGRVVRQVVDRLEQIVLEAAEQRGKRATVVAWEESPKPLRAEE